MNTPLGLFWSEFYDGIAMPLKSTICFFYFLLFFTLFTVYYGTYVIMVFSNIEIYNKNTSRKPL
jgi:hypothetical protein